MADNPLVMRAMGSVAGGVMNTAMGAALGMAEGAGMAVAPTSSSGLGHFAGRQVGRLAGFAVGGAAYLTGTATIGLAKATPKILAGVGSVTAGAYQEARSVVHTLTKPVPRTWDNLFTGRELYPSVSSGLQLGALALGVGLGLKRANDQISLGSIEIPEEEQLPEAMSYDGVTYRTPTRMGDMGGTGDLVHAMHANRHG